MTEVEKRKEEYLKKEFDKLNNEIANLMDEIRTRERYALLLISGVSAWLFTEVIMANDLTRLPLPSNDIIFFVFTVAFIIVLSYGISVYFLYENIKLNGSYLLEIENYFYNKEIKKEFVFGWEKYYADNSKKKPAVWLSKILWILFLIILAVAFCMFFFNG